MGAAVVVLTITTGLMISSSVPDPTDEQSSVTSNDVHPPDPAPAWMMSSSVTPSRGVVCCHVIGWKRKGDIILVSEPF